MARMRVQHYQASVEAHDGHEAGMMLGMKVLRDSGQQYGVTVLAEVPEGTPDTNPVLIRAAAGPGRDLARLGTSVGGGGGPERGPREPAWLN